jgi:hypothetical protein
MLSTTSTELVGEPSQFKGAIQVRKKVWGLIASHLPRSVVFCFMIDEIIIGASWLSTIACGSHARSAVRCVCVVLLVRCGCDCACGSVNGLVHGCVHGCAVVGGWLHEDGPSHIYIYIFIIFVFVLQTKRLGSQTSVCRDRYLNRVSFSLVTL